VRRLKLKRHEEAAIPDGAQAFADGLKGEKELVWLSGNQFDFYDGPSVAPSVEKVVAHLRRTLK